jgi:hypothetical protein
MISTSFGVSLILQNIYGIRHKWAKKYKETIERERGPLTRQSRPQHSPKSPTNNPRSGGPKPSPNPSRAVGVEARVKWTSMMHPDSILGHPPIHRKLTKSSISSQKYGPKETSQGVGVPPEPPFWPISRVAVH